MMKQERQRMKRVCVRLAKPMFDELKSAAEGRAQTLSEWTRQACLARLKDPVRESVSMSARTPNVDEEWVDMQLRLPVELVNRIRDAAALRSQRYLDFIRRAIKAQLAREALSLTD